MNCEGFRELLDAYIDGALTEAQEREFMNHADSCEECREELHAAQMLRDMMQDMVEEDVPLQAQAAWRGAVRQEAKKMRMKKWTRMAYGAAAALVLVFGVSFAFRGQDVHDEALPMQANMLIARDGGDSEAVSADASEQYSAMKKFECAAYDDACMTIELLCGEYSGEFTCDVSVDDGGRHEASYRISMPYEYMGDFLSAAGRIGTETVSEMREEAGETAVVMICISEK